MTQVARWGLVVYACLMAVGGILGYVLPEKASVVSLVAGVGAGILSVVAFALVRQDGPVLGLAIGLVVAAGVGVMMLLRFLETGSFMPAGMVMVLSGLMALLIVGALVAR